VIVIFARVPELLHIFWFSVGMAVEQRAGSMISFLAISGHTVRCLRKPGHFGSFVREAVPRVVPWAMAQHVTPRLYGCVVLDMVWNTCTEETRTPHLIQEYSIVRNILRTSPKMPNARKNVEKFAQDFYLGVFHPLEHLKFGHSLTSTVWPCHQPPLRKNPTLPVRNSLRLCKSFN
jgi:hypothetical protein